MITKVISGGQTGADRAGLFAARKFAIETGGYAPRGWLTESGTAPWLADYGLTECQYPQGDKPYDMPQWKWDAIRYVQRTKKECRSGRRNDLVRGNAKRFPWIHGNKKGGSRCPNAGP